MAMSLSPQDEAAVRAITQEHVRQVLAKDWAGWAATMAQDGVALPPDSAPLHGPKAAMEYLSTFPEVVAFTAEADRVGGAGNLAFSRGHGSMTLRIEGQLVNATIKFLAVIRKEPDGRWMMIEDMWNAGPAGA